MSTTTAFSPRIFYGLRMTASVALAMAVSFWLQLENAYWAPLTAAIVCQPTIGASLRKGQFRIVGTCLGAFGIVVLTALMPQSRIGLLAGLVVWAMLAGVAATLLRNTAAYAASLAGYTAVIVFSDAVDGTPPDVFLLAITRATEISIGVLSAGLVLSATDTGDARRRLAIKFAELVEGVARGLHVTLRTPGIDTVKRRRGLIGTLAALSPLIDEALGETADLRYRSATLNAAVEGILRSISAWNDVNTHLTAPANRPDDGAPIADPGGLADLIDLDWIGAPADARDRCRRAARRLVACRAASPSQRLLFDRTAESLLGLARGANALALLESPWNAQADAAYNRLYVPDLFIALTNGLRVGITMIVSAAIWIELAWPGGQGLMVFAAVITILFAPQASSASQIVQQFGLGVMSAVILGAIASFAILPGLHSYWSLILVIGVVMTPAAAMAAGTWNRGFFTAITFIFLALVAPANQQNYDLSSYMNGALSTVGGVIAGLLGFRLISPVDGNWQVRRLLALTLRDVRRFAVRRRLRPQQSWLGLLAARIGVLPPDADPADRSRLVAGFSAGEQILRLWRQSPRMARPERLTAALGLLAAGRVHDAIHDLRALAASQPEDPGGLRARVEIMLLSDVLTRHARFFADDPAHPPVRARHALS